jgi:8-oxo-dGTP pyrophosphatase MutT (NUDIX family)
MEKPALRRLGTWQLAAGRPSFAAMTNDSASEGIPAATIVIFRNAAAGGPPEVLMTVRSRELRFAGGMAVFPGGRVDPEDRALAQVLAAEHALDLDEAAHQIAAVRETLEETGLALGLAGDITAASAAAARTMLGDTGTLAPVLGALGWRLDLAQLVPFARWFPRNEKLSRVYDTRFYLADLGTGAVDVSIDETENTRLFWTTAQGALDAAEHGEIKLIFPTRRNLERLALFASFAEAKAQAEAIPVKTIMPQVVEQDGAAWLTILTDAGYPVTAELLETVARG